MLPKTFRWGKMKNEKTPHITEQKTINIEFKKGQNLHTVPYLQFLLFSNQKLN